MKITELMLGDWVRRRWTCTDTGREVVRDFQITEIRKNGETLYAWGKGGNMGRVEKLEPIPLTPDMLLTNGFEQQEMGGDRVAIWTGFGEDNCYDIEVEFDGDKPIHLKIDGPVYLVTPNIKYLHQLQHFLRDCETGKEIEL